MAGTGRRAGRRAGGAWREPPRLSSRAGGAGRGRTPSLNQFKTPGSNGFNCRALFPARGVELGRWRTLSGTPGCLGREAATLPRSGRARAPLRELDALAGTLVAAPLRRVPDPPPARWSSRRAQRLRNLGAGDLTVTSPSSHRTPCSHPSGAGSQARVHVGNYMQNRCGPRASRLRPWKVLR